jgi:hypothetical protein
MSPFDPSAGRSGHVGFTPMSGSPEVRLIRPATPTHLPPPMPKPPARERSERTSALIVIMLTLACTALAFYDMFLLAAGY